MMAAIFTSFLPIFPQSQFNSFGNVNKPQPIITANSFFIKFHTIKKLITHYSTKTHQDFKKPLASNQGIIVGRFQKLPFEIIFNSIDKFLCTFLDLPLRPTIDPKHVLSGWFAPVEELPPTACDVVEGSLPGCLDGVYIRNGPNPQFIPTGPYHVFDGDGMLHSIKISEGKATFCSRYVKTYKYTVERENIELGTVNPAYSGKKCRYIYSVMVKSPEMLVGAVKLDLSISGVDCTVASRFYGSGCIGGEPIFVAKDPNNPSAEEDDGYLITYTHDENGEESRFVVMDAKSPTLEIVASVKLPGRVSPGFHGIFVPETTLNKLYT